MNIYEKVTKVLIDKNITISFMESCTSGLIASLLTDTEGASSIFKGSYVTYSNETKIMAGVSAEIIDKYGVYSAECAKEMALVAKKSFGADIGVGITGTTGNVDPNNSDSSVQGEAYYCIIFGDLVNEYHIKEDVSNMNRKYIKEYYASEVYKSLNELLEK